MAKYKGELKIDYEKCKGCGLCVEVCAKKTLQMSKGVNLRGYNYVEAVNEDCIGCANCALVCPDAIFEIYRIKLEE